LNTLRHLVEATVDAEQEKSAIEMAIFLWNASVMSASKSEMFKRVEGILAEADSLVVYDADFEETVDFMCDRKKTRFSDDERFVMHYTLDIGERVYLQVASVADGHTAERA
jgi:hypothetical protein